MIDSIRWQLNKEQFVLKKQNGFDSTSTKNLRGYSGKTIFCWKHANTAKKQNRYFPMIEISIAKRGSKKEPEKLTAQLSLGKLLYGSNVFEPTPDDLSKIYSKTVSLLNEIGVETSAQELKKAIISKADFSKIIILPPYLGKANEVILKLTSFNYKPCSEFDFINYREGKGNLIRFGNSTQKYTIYDKIGEIAAKGYTKSENTILEAVKIGKSANSILKFELSYNRKDSFEKAMRCRLETTKKKDFCLEEILREDLSGGILLKAFDSVFESTTVGLISLSEMEENNLFSYLEKSNLSKHKQAELFYWVRMATKDGIAGVWKELRRKYSGGSISRKKGEISLILQELGKITGNIPNLIDFLREEHEKFEIIKPKSNSQL